MEKEEKEEVKEEGLKVQLNKKLNHGIDLAMLPTSVPRDIREEKADSIDEELDQLAEFISKNVDDEETSAIPDDLLQNSNPPPRRAPLPPPVSSGGGGDLMEQIRNAKLKKRNSNANVEPPKSPVKEESGDMMSQILTTKLRKTNNNAIFEKENTPSPDSTPNVNPWAVNLRKTNKNLD